VFISFFTGQQKRENSIDPLMNTEHKEFFFQVGLFLSTTVHNEETPIFE
jgi:hypothetical protein